MILYATGAYGRRATLKDWEAGKDFAARPSGPWVGGRYFSKLDLLAIRKLGYTEIRFSDPRDESLIGWRVEL